VVGILQGIGAPVNKVTVLACELWAQQEGGLYYNNPFNYIAGGCVGKEKGAKYPCQVPGDSGSYIPAFPTMDVGVAATVAYLNQTNMSPVRKALIQGTSLKAIFHAFSLSEGAYKGQGGWQFPAGYPGPLGACVNNGDCTPGAAFSKGASSNYVPSKVVAGGGTGADTGYGGGSVRGCAAKGNVFSWFGGNIGMTVCQAKSMWGTGLLVSGAVIFAFGIAIFLKTSPLGGKISGAADAVIGGVGALPFVGGTAKKAAGGAEPESHPQTTIAQRNAWLKQDAANKKAQEDSEWNKSHPFED
jgi:hypothetical protein